MRGRVKNKGKKIKKLLSVLVVILFGINLIALNVAASTTIATSTPSGQDITSQTTTEVSATNPVSIKYCTHVENIGWQNWVSNGELAGTEGRSLRVEALKISAEGSSDVTIRYRAHVQNVGWQNWVSNGQIAGTEGKALRVEALQIEATGLPDNYHLEYRAHVQNVGWQDWVTNGEIAGTQGRGLRVEAIEIRLVENDQYSGAVKYSSRVKNVGWQDWKTNVATSGSTENDTIEAFKVQGTDLGTGVAIRYRANVQDIGWQDWVTNGAVAGTEQLNKRLEALQIEVDGLPDNEQFIYRVYIADTGWQSWKNSGDIAGAVGEGKSIQALQIKIADKEPQITYQAHVQDIGWQTTVKDGELAGTTGQSKRVEALKIQLANFTNGSIAYRTHVQDIGWQDWKSDGQLTGTQGLSKRIEAIQIKCVGLPANYQVQYRVHVQDVGWQDWKTDEQIAGTVGQSKRIEAIQIRVVRATKIKPIQNIDKPEEGTVLTSSFSVEGWALSYSGVKNVQVYVDNKLLGETVPNIERQDVYKTYPQYKSVNSGYKIDNIDFNKINPGERIIEVRQTGNDGYIYSTYKKVTIQKKPNLINIESPIGEYIEKSDTLTIKGWALNASGVEKVNILLDGQLKQTVSTNEARADVDASFPGYINGKNSGYSGSISLSGIKYGEHNIVVSAVGFDGSIKEAIVKFYYKSKGKTIVIDPGHNYGGDYGATSTINGVTYSETVLNMQIASYLAQYLQQAGFNVILTRQASDRDTVTLTQSLANRVNIANTANADLFVSIHENSFPGSDPNGVEVYSLASGTTPDDGYSWPNESYKRSKSDQLASVIDNNLASSTGFYNRGAKQANYYVLRNTQMPSVLVECGFISNPTDAARLSQDAMQRTIAKSICDSIVNSF